MIPAPRNVGSFCICHSRHSPSGGFLNTLIHDKEGFTPATNDGFTMYTFTTACNHAECQQTVYIKKEGKKHSQRKKSWVLVCVSGHTLGFHPLPYTTLSRYSMASKRAGWFLLSISTHDLLHSGLGYHVSGTSKSLAELSEMLPGGKGQNEMNKERGTEHPVQSSVAAPSQRGGNRPQTGHVCGDRRPANRGDSTDISITGRMNEAPFLTWLLLFSLLNRRLLTTSPGEHTDHIPC